MNYKDLDSPGPLSSHIGPVHESIYTPVIPSKNNVYSERLEPLQVGEEVEFPCKAVVSVAGIDKILEQVQFIFPDMWPTFNVLPTGEMDILIGKEFIPLLIETLQRALISFK
jgi:hypothetical protein